jgi:hypothetical protein
MAPACGQPPLFKLLGDPLRVPTLVAAADDADQAAGQPDDTTRRAM